MAWFLLEGCQLSGLFYSFVDWGPKVDVVGFCFLDLASNYEPPESLSNWLKAGTRPIYVGFGSLVSSLLMLPSSDLSSSPIKYGLKYFNNWKYFLFLLT